MSEVIEETSPDTDEEIAEQMAEDEELSEPGEPADDETEDAARLAELEAQAKAEEKEAAKVKRAFDNATGSYFKKMEELFGDDFAMLQPCPRCAETWPGLIWPHSTRAPLPDTIAATKLSMGEGVEPEYRTSERASTCPKCDGFGKVRTGSNVRGQERIRCYNCRGKGWTGVAEQDVANDPQQVVEANVDAITGEIVEQPQTDPWGRPKGDRLYGVMPGFEPE